MQMNNEELKISPSRLRHPPRACSPKQGVIWLQSAFYGFFRYWPAWFWFSAATSLLLLLRDVLLPMSTFAAVLFVFLLPFIFAAAFRVAQIMHEKANFLPQDLSIGLKVPGAFLRLVLWMLLILLVVVLVISPFVGVDNGRLTFQSPLLALPLLIAGFGYLFAGAFYAPALILFQRLGVIRAWQQSVYGLWRNLLPSLVNTVLLVAITLPVFLIFSILAQVLGLTTKDQLWLLQLLFFPANSYAVALVYGSAYAAYRDIFLEEETLPESGDEQEKEVLF
jgi:hypothetical protein